MKVEAGWLYKGPITTEQNQGWYVPVAGKEGMWLLDTYGLSSTSSVVNIIGLGTGDHDWTLRKVRSDYYYGSSMMRMCVGGEVPEGFEAVCYLPDWEQVSDREALDYDPSDVCGPVQLYFEHGYRWYSGVHGVMLRRKGAGKSDVAMLDKLVSDALYEMQTPRAARIGGARELAERIGDLPDDLAKKYARMVERNGILERMEREYKDLISEGER